MDEKYVKLNLYIGTSGTNEVLAMDASSVLKDLPVCSFLQWLISTHWEKIGIKHDKQVWKAESIAKLIKKSQVKLNKEAKDLQKKVKSAKEVSRLLSKKYGISSKRLEELLAY